MGWEGIASITAIVGLLITLIGGGFSICFFFGKIISRFDNLINDFNQFVFGFKEHMVKEDATHNAMWGKIDGHSEKLVEHHQRIITLEKKEI